MHQHEHRATARALVANMGARAVRQHQELRRRRRVFRFQDTARNIRLAEIVKRTRKRHDDDQ